MRPKNLSLPDTQDREDNRPAGPTTPLFAIDDILLRLEVTSCGAYGEHISSKFTLRLQGAESLEHEPILSPRSTAATEIWADSGASVERWVLGYARQIHS